MIIPVAHRILVKQDRLEEKDEKYRSATAAGILIPTLDEKDREQAAIDTGTVVSVGKTAFRDFGFETSPVKPGDLVVFAKYSGKAVVDPETEEKFVVLNDEDCVAIITAEKGA